MSEKIQTPLLDTIHSAQDLRKLPIEELPNVCSEIRQYIVDSVSKTAGHLASGLAVVELTTALHYVFDTPNDKLVWDVGHQSYPHKILTGHKDELRTVRQKDGLHAFIWRNETPYDLLSTGHASTSIGSALGLAVAQRQLKTKHKVVAIIGDGALSGGCAYEGINCAGSQKNLDLIVILNDNEMSISENVGSVAQYLAGILASPYYVKFLEGGRKVLENLPALKQLAEKAQEHVKGMIMPGTFFEELGFNYIGPIDGHNINNLVSILQNVKKIGGLQLVHVVTKKGKGYEPAEENPTLYHGVPTFDPSVGIVKSKKEDVLSYSEGFGRWLCKMAEADQNLIGVTPAMPVGSGMHEFSERFKDRFFDVGIAEQHALVFASGLAAGGMHPVVVFYSTFLQRAYDGLIHDMAIQDLPIVVAVDRAGIVGPDGPTHQGMFDIAFARCIPNLIIMTPANLQEQFIMLNSAYKSNKPAMVRYERDFGCAKDLNDDLDVTYEIGKAQILNQGKKIALCAFGTVAEDLLELSKEYDLTLVNMRFIKPLDKECIQKLAKEHEVIISIEHGVIEGGIGQEVCMCAIMANSKVKVQALGFKDEFIMEGTRSELLAEQNLDLASIKQIILEYLGK